MKIAIAKPQISKEEINEVVKVLESGMLVQGKKVEEFEKKFAKYIGTKYAIATSNGTTASHTGLLASSIKSGDEIITTPFSFIASSNSILYCGAKPVFADVDSKTFNLDPERVKEKITEKTKGVLIVHLYGQPCDMGAFNNLCEDNDLILIEDACQAHGAEFNCKKVGGFGDVACFSFYPTKNITTGEGGMIVTNSKEIADKCRLLRNHGQEKRYFHVSLGFNFRMTEFQAAIGVEQLKKLEKWNKIRINNAKFLTEHLEKIDNITPPFVNSNVKHVFHQYTIRSKKISNIELSKKLTRKGVDNKIYYPVPIHKQLQYQELGYTDHLPEVELASKEVLSLPVHPCLKEDDLNFIVENVKEVLR